VEEGEKFVETHEKIVFMFSVCVCVNLISFAAIFKIIKNESNQD